MKLFRHLLILCLLFIIPWTHSELLQFKNFSLIHRKMESISIESCISENLNPIVVSNDIRNVIGESLWTKEIIPTISIAENFGISNDSVIFFPKLPTYILSTNDLQNILQKIKSSPWWNIKSYFIIVEVSQNCNDNDAWNKLQVMRKMNLLSSLFICRDTDNTVTLYTYNPYANYAPQPWQYVNTIFKKQGQQWTLFKKLDSSDWHGCKDLFFDKTKLLNGSEVIAVKSHLLHPMKVEIAYDVDSIRNLLPNSVTKTFKEIFSVLNVRPIIYYTDPEKAKGVTFQTREHFLNDLVNGRYDIALKFYTITDDTFDFLYPRVPEIFLIVTHHRKVLLSLDKMESVFNTEVMILTVIVFAITWIVLTLCKRLSVGSGLLEILRLILSTSILLKFYRSSLKIFMISILVFVMFMNSIYQSHMSAYSTKLYREEINSITDLQNLKYTIYIKPYLTKIFGVDLWTDTHKKYVQFVKFDSCKSVINGNDSRTACLTRIGALKKTLDRNLRVCLHSIQQFRSLAIRNDWPLKPRVDHIMSQLSKGGFLQLWEDLKGSELQRKIEFKESETFDRYRPIVLSDLYSIFLLFFIFLAISFLVFIVEVSVARLRAYME